MSNLLNLGKVLTSAEQKNINGGSEALIQEAEVRCQADNFDCPEGMRCITGSCSN